MDCYGWLYACLQTCVMLLKRSDEDRGWPVLLRCLCPPAAQKLDEVEEEKGRDTTSAKLRAPICVALHFITEQLLASDIDRHTITRNTPMDVNGGSSEDVHAFSIVCGDGETVRVEEQVAKDVIEGSEYFQNMFRHSTH
jgi:hypothetical protein